MPKLRETYTVEMDARGHIVIPSAVRKAKGLAAHSLFLLVPEGDELRLLLGEFRVKREVRMYSHEEIAQSLMESAVTPDGLKAARLAVRELGLDPTQFQPDV